MQASLLGWREGLTEECQVIWQISELENRNNILKKEVIDILEVSIICAPSLNIVRY